MKSTEELAADLDEQGYAIAEGMLEPQLVDDILENISELEGANIKALTPTEFTGFNTVRFFDLLNKGEVWQRVATQRGVTDVVRAMIGVDCLLSTMGTALIGPGEPPQPFHGDDGLYVFDRPHKPLVCNTVWALNDFTAENGATRVVPGSHKWDSEPDFTKTYDFVPAIMPKGSVCFIMGTIYHSGGANDSDERRMGLTINYCAGVMRQQENLMLSVDRELARTFTPDLQDLIGYRRTKSRVGHINADDPRKVLDAS